MVSTRSTAFSMRYSSSIEPASVTVRLLRLKPVAIRWSRVAPGSRSPAICSITNWSNGMVAIERGDDPVAPGPHGAGEVVLKAVGVGVAGAVEPVHRHALAVMGRGEQAIDERLVGPGRRSARNASTSAGCRRQADQVERQPADQRGAVGRRRRARPSASSRASTKRSIGFAEHGDRARPAAQGRRTGSNAQCLLQCAPRRSTSRELDLPRASASCPTSAAASSRRGRGSSRGCTSSLSPLLPGTITGSPVPQRDLLEVEPQVGLARLGVRAVAGEAVLRKDRQDVAAEIDRGRLAAECGRSWYAPAICQSKR